MTGYERDPTVDEVSRKEYLRKNRRRPVDEIVNELGEGRGMHMTSRGVAREAEHGLLTPTQESLLPVTSSAGPSASRPTTALTCRSPLHRRYVTYTQQYYSPCSNVLARLRLLLRHGSRSHFKNSQPRIPRSNNSTTASMHTCLCGDWILGTTYGTAYLCRFLGSGLSASEQLLSQIHTAMVLPSLSL